MSHFPLARQIVLLLPGYFQFMSPLGNMGKLLEDGHGHTSRWNVCDLRAGEIILERRTDRSTVTIQMDNWQTSSLENEPRKHVTSRKQLSIHYQWGKNRAFKTKLRKLENRVYHSELDTFPKYRDFLDEISSHINKCGGFMLSCNKMRQHLEDLCTSVNTLITL